MIFSWFDVVIMLTEFLVFVAVLLSIIFIPVYYHDRAMKRYDDELWLRCIEMSDKYKVYCLGQEINMDKLNFRALNRNDWVYKLDDKNKSIYLNPREGWDDIKLPFVR